MRSLEIMISKRFLQFQIVWNTVTIHGLETMLSFFSLQFQIVSNIIRMHALETSFSKTIIQYQLVSNSVRMRSLEIMFSFFLWSSKSSECMHAYETLFSKERTHALEILFLIAIHHVFLIWSFGNYFCCYIIVSNNP